MLAATETKALEKARAKREVRRVVEDALARLDAADRRDVLADLFVDTADGPIVVSPPSARPLNGARSEASSPPVGREQARRSGAGRPKGSTAANTSGRTATLLRVLAERPGMPIKEMAMAVYGSDATKTQNKTRSLLVAQKRSGKVNNPVPGKWEVVTGDP